MKISASLAAVMAASTRWDSARASMMVYEPLSCNTDIASCDVASATPLSSLVDAADPTSHVTIPCNTCAYVDYTDGSTVTLPNGIDVVGRLIFPSSANVELKVKAIFVQGMLDIAKPDAGNKVTVHMYGDTEVEFYPHDEPNMPSNVGYKPIVVAGGT